MLLKHHILACRGHCKNIQFATGPALRTDLPLEIKFSHKLKDTCHITQLISFCLKWEMVFQRFLTQISDLLEKNKPFRHEKRGSYIIRPIPLHLARF